MIKHKYNSELEIDHTTVKTRSFFEKTIMDFKFVLKKDEVVQNNKVHGYILDDLKDKVKNFFLEQIGNPIIFQVTIGALYT